MSSCIHSRGCHFVIPKYLQITSSSLLLFLCHCCRGHGLRVGNNGGKLIFENVLIQSRQSRFLLTQVFKWGESRNVASKHKDHYVCHWLSSDASCASMMKEIGMRLASAAGSDCFKTALWAWQLYTIRENITEGFTRSAAQTHGNWHGISPYWFPSTALSVHYGLCFRVIMLSTGVSLIRYTSSPPVSIAQTPTQSVGVGQIV